MYIWTQYYKRIFDISQCRQEGVHNDVYIPLIKEITTPYGERIECRLYQMLNTPTNKIDLTDPQLPHDRQPSQTYLDVIVKGAIESQLPEKYVTFLKNITHNGQLATSEMMAKLKDWEFVDKVLKEYLFLYWKDDGRGLRE